MMKRLLIFVAVLLPFLSEAQNKYSRDYIGFAAGPSMIYGDNTGNFNRLRFNIRPAASLTFNKQASRYLDFRATLGTQVLDSGPFAEQQENLLTLADWGVNGHAMHFTGTAWHADFMPVLTFNPNYPGRVGNVVNWYTGVGLGYMWVVRDQETMNENFTIQESRQETASLYIPFRFGIRTNLEAKWELAFEYTALAATTSAIDGNETNNKALPIDILNQFQMKIIRYINRDLHK